MELKNRGFAAKKGILARILQWVNLRPEESDRTWLMFSFYTFTSVGLRWSEDSTVALFLDKYGALWLPSIYIASAVMGTLLVLLLVATSVSIALGDSWDRTLHVFTAIIAASGFGGSDPSNWHNFFVAVVG